MKKKVLIVTESISYGGLNLASMHFQEYLDSDKFECVYCVRRSALGSLEQNILDRGIRVIHVPDSELGYLKSYKFYKKIMKEEQFDIVHCHLPFISGIVLLAARQSGVKKRIAHAHFSQAYTDTAIYSRKKQAVATVYRQVMRLFLKMFCNGKIACSQKAGEFLYGKREFQKNGVILNNGIDTREFKFSESTRKSIRKKLGIPQDSIVLGHIGQLYSVKNQSFVIDVFNALYCKHKNSYLLIIGDGTDREMLEEKVKVLGLTDNVLFLGLRNDADKLYQAMDCFVFPSLHEGFPLTLIEAQASKLSCLVSDTVTKDTKLNENVKFKSIKEPAADWAEEVEKLISFDRESIDNSAVIENFDIKNVTLELEKIYLS